MDEKLLHPLSLELFSESSTFCAISSVVERLLHTQEVAGSNPASRNQIPEPIGGIFRREKSGFKNLRSLFSHIRVKSADGLLYVRVRTRTPRSGPAQGKNRRSRNEATIARNTNCNLRTFPNSGHRERGTTNIDGFKISKS
jgi:hypothetical protein